MAASHSSYFHVGSHLGLAVGYVCWIINDYEVLASRYNPNWKDQPVGFEAALYGRSAFLSRLDAVRETVSEIDDQDIVHPDTIKALLDQIDKVKGLSTGELTDFITSKKDIVISELRKFEGALLTIQNTVKKQLSGTGR
jgi:hypothetical protein